MDAVSFESSVVANDPWRDDIDRRAVFVNDERADAGGASMRLGEIHRA